MRGHDRTVGREAFSEVIQHILQHSSLQGELCTALEERVHLAKTFMREVVERSVRQSQLLLPQSNLLASVHLAGITTVAIVVGWQ